MSGRLRFDVFGRLTIEVIRTRDGWDAYEVREGRRSLRYDVPIPVDLRPDDVQQYLADLFHELARPGTEVRRIDG